jgi:hypothetical protein
MEGLERQGSTIINRHVELEQRANEEMINSAILEAQRQRELERAQRDTAALEAAAAAHQRTADSVLENSLGQDMSDDEFEQEMALLELELGEGTKRKRHTRRKHTRRKHKSRRLRHKHKSRRLRHKHKSRRLRHKHKSRRLRHRARGIGSAIKRTVKSVMGKLRRVPPAISKSISKSRRKRAAHRYDMQNSTIDQKLIDAALYGYSVDDVNNLIRLGGNINAVDHNGISVIKIASIKGHDHIVELLSNEHGVPMPMRSHHSKKRITFGSPSIIRSVKVISPRHKGVKPSRRTTTRRTITSSHKSPAGKKLKKALSIAKRESRKK